jgi:hypothetical protein
VDTFTDPLPDEVFDALYFLATEKHLKEKLDAERIYATGAQSLLKLIERRKAEWGRKVPHSMTLCGLVHVADGTCSAANAPGERFRNPSNDPAVPTMLIDARPINYGITFLQARYFVLKSVITLDTRSVHYRDPVQVASG